MGQLQVAEVVVLVVAVVTVLVVAVVPVLVVAVVPVLVVAGKAVDYNGYGQGEGEDPKNSTEASQDPPKTSLDKTFAYIIQYKQLNCIAIILFSQQYIFSCSI